MSFTFGNRLISKLHLEIPRRGIASADIELAEPVSLSGRQTIVAGNLSLVGTITDGAVVAGRGQYHWVAGNAGWSKVILERGYPASLVNRSTVIRDAAQACGEMVNQPGPDASLGLPGNGGWFRPAGPAWDVLKALDEVAPLPWYVDSAGTTQIAERPGGAAYTDGTLEGSYPEDGRLVIVPNQERIAGYLPGLSIGGALITRTVIDAEAERSIRVTLYTRSADGMGSDLRAELDALHAQNAAALRYHGRYRYKIVSRNGTLYGLQPADPTLLLPRLDNRDLWFGLPGFDATLDPADPALTVVVSFLDGLASRAVIDGFIRDGTAGSIPALVSLDANRVDLGDATKRVARQDDVSRGPRIEFIQAGPAVTLSITNPAGTDGATVAFTIASSSGALTVTPVPPVTGINQESALNQPTQDKVYA